MPLAEAYGHIAFIETCGDNGVPIQRPCSICPETYAYILQLLGYQPHSCPEVSALPKRDHADATSSRRPSAIVMKRVQKLPRQVVSRMQTLLKTAVMNAHGPSGLEKLFRKYDKDRSGSLSAEEFRRVVRVELKLNSTFLSDKDLDALLVALDCDGNATLSVDEVASFIDHGAGTFFAQAGGEADDDPATHLMTQGEHATDVAGPGSAVEGFQRPGGSGVCRLDNPDEALGCVGKEHTASAHLRSSADATSFVADQYPRCHDSNKQQETENDGSRGFRGYSKGRGAGDVGVGAEDATRRKESKQRPANLEALRRIHTVLLAVTKSSGAATRRLRNVQVKGVEELHKQLRESCISREDLSDEDIVLLAQAFEDLKADQRSDPSSEARASDRITLSRFLDEGTSMFVEDPLESSSCAMVADERDHVHGQQKSLEQHARNKKSRSSTRRNPSRSRTQKGTRSEVLEIGDGSSIAGGGGISTEPHCGGKDILPSADAVEDPSRPAATTARPCFKGVGLQQDSSRGWHGQVLFPTLSSHNGGLLQTPGQKPRLRPRSARTVEVSGARGIAGGIVIAAPEVLGLDLGPGDKSSWTPGRRASMSLVRRGQA
eukprot:TRINITY_DN4330_c0_g1_i1.p1 TRINITY_DN4330_c0_g1~~TRINITY_DN4330_c0_g1_i1.p1  ORF type:complete len:604 (+),score=90.83 TRINITY_DN4330_c0_g1_i1:221-2032(+)